jgi:hypothetical protein
MRESVCERKREILRLFLLISMALCGVCFSRLLLWSSQTVHTPRVLVLSMGHLYHNIHHPDTSKEKASTESINTKAPIILKRKQFYYFP